MGKSALEQLLSSYNWWMGISTVAVAIGILGEYVAHFIFEEEARHNKREMAVSILFGALVLGGVVGEYIFGKKLTQVSEQLQQIADTQVAQSNKDAAQARRDADTAKRDAATANENAGAANERATKNEREAAQLRKDAEAEHLARVTIEAKVAWRHLTKKQQSDIGVSLGDFSNEEGASFWYEAGDTEAGMFAVDLAEALRVARIIVQPPGSVVKMRESGHFGDPIKPFDTGVSVSSAKGERSRSLADALVRELSSRGFDAKRGEDTPPNDEETKPLIWIWVNPRPEGPQGEFKLEAEREGEAKKQTQRHKIAK